MGVEGSGERLAGGEEGEAESGGIRVRVTAEAAMEDGGGGGRVVVVVIVRKLAQHRLVEA